jgi:hypothetical protein
MLQLQPLNPKVGKMSDIVTAMKVAEASQDGMTSLHVMMAAAELYQATLNNPTPEEMQELIFKYSATLTASVATRVTHVLMTEEQINSMVDQIDMFEQIEKDVLGE